MFVHDFVGFGLASTTKTAWQPDGPMSEHEASIDQEPTGVGWNFTEENSSCGPGRTMTYHKEASVADEKSSVCSAAEQAEAEFDATAYETRPSSPPPKARGSARLSH